MPRNTDNRRILLKMTSVFYVNNVLRTRDLIVSKLILYFLLIQLYIFIF
jgi:hypothetical protein